MPSQIDLWQIPLVKAVYGLSQLKDQTVKPVQLQCSNCKALGSCWRFALNIPPLIPHYRLSNVFCSEECCVVFHKLMIRRLVKKLSTLSAFVSQSEKSVIYDVSPAAIGFASSADIPKTDPKRLKQSRDYHKRRLGGI